MASAMVSCRQETRPILECRNIAKHYSGVKALDNASIVVQSGSVSGLIGPNGSGKSTLLDCITGVQALDSGEIIFERTPINRPSPHRVAQLGVSRTFQNVHIYDELTVIDHLIIANQEFDGVSWWRAFFGGKRVRDIERSTEHRARDLLGAVGLGEQTTWPATVLSYGQRKLLGLASALMSEPKLVLLDEPLAGVNPRLAKTISRVIIDLNANGHTFLVVEHNVPFVMATCDHITVLNFGQVLASGEPGILHSNREVYEAYIGLSERREEE